MLKMALVKMMAGEILGSIFRAEAEGSKFYGPCCMILSDLQKHSSRKKATHGQFLIDFFILFPLLVLLDHTDKQFAWAQYIPGFWF